MYQTVTGLSTNTLYHYRGYATNTTGTGYSPDATFSTTPVTPFIIPNPIGATIIWTTDIPLSSMVDYGPTISRGLTPYETNTSPRVTDHTYILNSLVPCTTYYYRVRSLDAGNNIVSLSDDHIFTTTGCAGAASVLDQDQGDITPDTGGTVNLIADDTTGITLDIPVGATPDTEEPVTYQIKALDQEDVFTSSGTPSGLRTVGDYAFDLKALTDIGTAVASFLEPIEITMHYQDSDLIGIIEGTLLIYRYDGTTWTPLTNCVVNTEANTVTCTTTHFSVFSLFGQTNVVSSGGSGGGSSWTPAPIIKTPTKTTPTQDQTARQKAFSDFLTKTLKENKRT